MASLYKQLEKLLIQWNQSFSILHHSEKNNERIILLGVVGLGGVGRLYGNS